MQRDVEFEVETVDKSGGFIGALYLNKNENAAVALVQEGLASVHAFSAENLPWAQQLFTAESEAKKAKKNVSFFDCLIRASSLIGSISSGLTMMRMRRRRKRLPLQKQRDL